MNLPKPVYKKQKWTHLLIWIIPAVVAVIAALYGKTYFNQQGRILTIEVTSADGLKVGDTPVMHRGVTIGKVIAIELNDTAEKAILTVRLGRKAEAFASEGASFWVVRPEVSGMDVQALGTLFSGPYVEANPGKGEVEKKEFVGLAKPPVYFGEGLVVKIHAPHMMHLEPHSPIYYRGVQVGVVKDLRLSGEANQVEARLLIWQHYRPLVRTHSVFWPMSGFDVKGGLFSGVDLKLQSVKALVSGAVAFATPEKDMGEPAKPGTDFPLAESVKDDWLKWSPKISIKSVSADAEEEKEESEPTLKSPGSSGASQGGELNTRKQ